MERARTHVERLCELATYEPDFWFGFVAGQAEKVWLEAVPAAMFRPPSADRDRRVAQVIDVASEYDLAISYIGREIWIHKHGFQIGDFGHVNSPGYHEKRAKACGIPVSDPLYHERP